MSLEQGIYSCADRSLSVCTNEEDKTSEALFNAYLMIAAEVRDICGA